MNYVGLPSSTPDITEELKLWLKKKLLKVKLHTLDMENNSQEKHIMANKDNSDTIRVFVSYSWDTSEHEEKVFDFVNHLRTNGGFDEQMDKGQ